jgi:SPP1 gp7 family putative phage head morphogenesis protein
MFAFASRKSPVLPRVSFTQAVRDLLAKEPTLARGFHSIPEESRRRKAFWLAKSSSVELTRKIRDTVARMLREGKVEAKAGAVLAEMGNWTEAYGRTVYRTNLATAYSGGRMAQAKDPAVAEVIGGFEFNAILDGDARRNHAAAHGLVAATNDPIWNRYMPPLGFNCRCSLRMVDRVELKQRHLLRAGRVVRREPATFKMAHPDEGFGGRMVG